MQTASVSSSLSALSAGENCDDGSNKDANMDEDRLADEDLDDFCELVDDFGCSAVEKFCEAVDDDNGESDFQWIRLENRASNCLSEVSSREDVLRRIQEVKTEQSKYGNADLYNRRWLSGRAEEEQETQVESKPEAGCLSSDSFSVLQFNMLAEGLSSGPSSKIPFQNNGDNNKYSRSEEQCYGGFSEIPHPKTTLDFSLRRWRLLEVILGSDGKAPFGLIGLEEIDRFRGFFAPIMRMFGYSGVFVPKTRSPCVPMGWYSDGCSLFWKTNTFELLTERRIEYKVGNQVAIVAAFRHRPTKLPLLVAVTHLKAKNGPDNERTRVAQVNELLSRVNAEVKEAARREDVEEDTIPILVLGDFNAEPPSQSRDVEDEDEVSAIQHVLTTSRPRFKSAYSMDSTEYTTWKSRGTKTSKRVIDYIFYTAANLECQATLSLPEGEELESTKLPGLRYPSDHLAIAVVVKLLNNK